MPGSRDTICGSISQNRFAAEVCFPASSSSSLYRHFRNIKYARRPPLQMQCYWFGVNPQSRSNMIWYQQWLNETSPSKNGRRGERLSGFSLFTGSLIFVHRPLVKDSVGLSSYVLRQLRLILHSIWVNSITLATWLSSSLLKKKKALRVLKLQRWTRH